MTMKRDDDDIKTSTYGLDDIQDENFDRNFWEMGTRQLPRAVRDLRTLFQLSQAEPIVINVVGGDAINGSDLRSQIKIREICRIVKRLLRHFGPRLRVVKLVQINGAEESYSQVSTGCWDEPTAEVEARVLEGYASFKDIMQLLIDEWARLVPQRLTMDSFRISLL